MPTTEQTQPRLLTEGELAVVVRFFRESRQWSQEQLADLSGLSVRTIQRVERGDASGFDTRRAIARAFEFEDIDALNKPFSIRTAEEMQAAKEKFDREHVTLKALPLKTGKQPAKLAEAHSMDLSALVQMGSANRLKLSERNELMSGDEQAEKSGGVVRRTPF
ncbi:helix-turn-helix transcriptional regulator [Paraburkholderia sp. RL18-103-BIB-C]|uniref:helix-turn-helix domain-containing protein n=1 Tax=unclassified Paraburkholderia TaxID=2615204 RepID=UPI0038B969DC